MQEGLYGFIEHYLDMPGYLDIKLKEIVDLICSLDNYDKRREYMIIIFQKLGHIK